MLLHTAYLPPTAWFASAHQAVGVFLEQHEHFQKGTWRNRCLIGGPNGNQLLSIPLQKGKNNQTTIREVRIAYEIPWQRNHLRSIQSAYGSAPFFPYYETELTNILSKQHTFLFDLNLELIQFLAKGLKLHLDLHLTQAYQGNSGLLPIDVPPYPQVFESKFGFRPGLSGLDLLMCGGTF